MLRVRLYVNVGGVQHANEALSSVSPQYYEMSYGLNIEMHKQVSLTASHSPLCAGVLGWKLLLLSRREEVNVLFYTHKQCYQCVILCGWVFTVFSRSFPHLYFVFSLSDLQICQ